MLYIYKVIYRQAEEEARESRQVVQSRRQQQAEYIRGEKRQ